MTYDDGVDLVGRRWEKRAQGSCFFSFFCILLNLTNFFCLLRFYLCLKTTKRIRFGCDEKKWAQMTRLVSFGLRVCFFFFFFHVLLIFFGLFRLYSHYKETGKVGLAGNDNNRSKGMCFFILFCVLLILTNGFFLFRFNLGQQQR